MLCFLLLVSSSDQFSFEGTESKTLREPFKLVIYLNLNRKRADTVPAEPERRPEREPESRLEARVRELESQTP